jgi:hypothetical protein
VVVTLVASLGLLIRGLVPDVDLSLTLRGDPLLYRSGFPWVWKLEIDVFFKGFFVSTVFEQF